MDPLLRAGTRTSFRRRSRRTAHIHGARGEEATGSDSHLQAGIVAIQGHSTSLASTSGVPGRLGAPTDHPGSAAPPNTPLRSRSRRTRSTGSRSRISTIENIPQSPIQQGRQSAPQQLLTGMGIDGTTPPQRHGHHRDFGRIERTTDSQAFPPTVEATIHAHREDNKPLTPPQKISQPDLHSLEQALRADLGQSCPPRAQSSSTPSTKLVPGAKRAAADLSKRERARRL